MIVETIKRTSADQKRSCGYAPHIQMLINSKMGIVTYLLDKEHLPLKPNFEDNTVVMNAEDPTSVEAQGKRQKAKAEKAQRCQVLKRLHRFSSSQSKINLDILFKPL